MPRSVVPRSVMPHSDPCAPAAWARPAVIGGPRVKGLGYGYLAPVALGAIVMLGVALLNNIFICFTAKRKYPSDGWRARARARECGG